MTLLVLAGTGSYVPLTWTITGWVVLALDVAFGPWRMRTLQERCTLSQNCLKGVNVFLVHLSGSGTNARKLDPGERATVGAEIPTRDQIAARRLMIDLSGRWERQVQLRWEM